MTGDRFLTIAQVAPLMEVSPRQARRRLRALSEHHPRLLRWHRGRLVVDIERLAEIEGSSDEHGRELEQLAARVEALEAEVARINRQGSR